MEERLYKNHDIEFFELFNNFYVFIANEQIAVSVKKETWEKLNKLKTAKNISLNSLKYSNDKSYSFINKLFENSLIQKHNTIKAPDFLYNSNMLSLVHTQRCNLNCRYCFAHDKSDKFDMSIETAKDAIDFFIKNFAPKNNYYSIDLTGAGEPLVNKKFIIAIVEYIKKLRDEGYNIFPAFITNGMLLDDEWEKIILENKISWAISLDGDKKHQEMIRKGSDYDKIIQNYLKLKNSTKWLHYGIRCTYSSENYAFVDIFESIYKVAFGFPITINPARTRPNDFGDFSEEKVDDLLQEYDKFCLYLLKLSLNLDLGRINSYFSGESYFRKFIGSILNKSKTIYRCSAGIQNIAINNEGNIFICTSMTGENEALLGNIHTGINLEKQDYIKKIYADNIPTCSICWARDRKSVV